MIITMRPGIKPKCTRHHALMQLAEFGDPTGVTIQAYRCSEENCTRAFNSSQGYFDLVNDSVMLLQMEQQNCPNCGLPMYVHSFNDDRTETWRCAQIGCKHSSQSSTNP